MTFFTQLGLSGSPDKSPDSKPQGKIAPKEFPNPKVPNANQRTAVLVGSAIATLLFAVFFLESGCSKESGKTTTTAIPDQVVSQPSRVASVSTAIAPLATQPPTKAKSRQRKLSTSTYTNAIYGVSFRYPKYDNLQEGDKANLELDGLGPVEMNFVQPGGITISAVELPHKLYTGTNLDAAFFNVSVNPKLTSEECQQFAFPQTDNPEADPVTVSQSKVGATEARAVEGFADDDSNQADVKYYHVFQNGSCYEFALGLEIADESNADQTKPAVKPVNSNEVFRQLDWILSTVKLQPVVTQEKTAPEVASDTPAAPTSTAH
jgi:hypothetical protein